MQTVELVAICEVGHHCERHVQHQFINIILLGFDAKLLLKNTQQMKNKTKVYESQEFTDWCMDEDYISIVDWKM